MISNALYINYSKHTHKAPTFNFCEGPNQILLTPVLEISNKLD